MAYAWVGTCQPLPLVKSGLIDSEMLTESCKELCELVQALNPEAVAGSTCDVKSTETPPDGFEPSTGCLEGSCSIQLS